MGVIPGADCKRCSNPVTNQQMDCGAQADFSNLNEYATQLGWYNLFAKKKPGKQVREHDDK